MAAKRDPHGTMTTQQHPRDDVVPDAASSAAAALRAVDVSKTYGEGELAVTALHPCCLELFPGTVTAVVGKSGSGKSTLMHVLAGLDPATTGEVWLGGLAISEMPERTRARWRARHVGFVLQRDNLIPSLSLAENVATPLLLSGCERRDAMIRAREALSGVGLSHRADALPSDVSGGESQRTTIARACAGAPRLMFCDEPTGALDSAAGRVVLDLIFSKSRTTGAATLLVTHDPDAARRADVIVRLDDGRVLHDATR